MRGVSETAMALLIGSDVLKQNDPTAQIKLFNKALDAAELFCKLAHAREKVWDAEEQRARDEAEKVRAVAEQQRVAAERIADAGGVPTGDGPR